MSQPLDILWCGAVTPVGLDAFQTAAAIRARIAGFQHAIPLTPPQEPLKAARIPVRANLQKTPSDWLINLAARGIRESLAHPFAQGKIALILGLPEKVRDHPVLAESHPERLPLQIEYVPWPELPRQVHDFRRRCRCCNWSRYGAKVAVPVMRTRAVVGGVDSRSLLTTFNARREAVRMIEPDLPQGLIPGEGSAFLLVTQRGRCPNPVATLFGASSAQEADSVRSPRSRRGAASLRPCALLSRTQRSPSPMSRFESRA